MQAQAVRIQRAWAVVAAATVLNLPLGSIYAFSLFLRPIEAELGLTRSALSLVFGLSTAAFTLGMLITPYFFGLTSATWLIAICMSASAIGIALAATADGLTQLLLGYGVLFGVGGGAAYIVALQGVNLMVTIRKGLVNGYVVGLYPAGAMLAAPLFGWSNAAFGYRWTMGGLALVLLLAGLLAMVLLKVSGMVLPRRVAGGASGERRGAIFARLWIVFFVAAAAGLTVLSQAAGIIAAYGGTTGVALAATTAIAGCIAVARLSGGWLTDRFSVPYVGAFAQGFALAGAILLTLWPNPWVATVALGMVGMGYGFISGCTAGAVALYWPPTDFGRIVSRIYIAWCVAAISLPILAGHLFDLTRSYSSTVIIAGCGNLIGVIVALGLPPTMSRGRPRAAG